MEGMRVVLMDDGGGSKLEFHPVAVAVVASYGRRLPLCSRLLTMRRRCGHKRYYLRLLGSVRFDYCSVIYGSLSQDGTVFMMAGYRDFVFQLDNVMNHMWVGFEISSELYIYSIDVIWRS